MLFHETVLLMSLISPTAQEVSDAPRGKGANVAFSEEQVITFPDRTQPREFCAVREYFGPGSGMKLPPPAISLDQQQGTPHQERDAAWGSARVKLGYRRMGHAAERQREHRASANQWNQTG
jgi:hypothetical protein